MQTTSDLSFDRVCAALETLLYGPVRAEIVAQAARADTLGHALARLRDPLRTNVWKIDGGTIDLERAIRKYDKRTRQEGFHVLNDWDGISDTVNADTIPVDVLHYLVDQRGEEPVDTAALAILLDYHLMHVLALLSVRIWDEGDADENLDRLGMLLALLQGPDSSGQRFADDAATLILIATSHYELHERGYETLLQRVRSLDDGHRLAIALGHASSMGCHLRFGFEATYGRDTVNMRDDNVADYPWLCFALATSMREYDRLAQSADAAPGARDRLVEALLNGLSGDARAFVGVPPASLARSEPERVELLQRFVQYRPALLSEFERFRPTPQRYSPLSFYFNFSHNVVKGAVIDALLRGEPWPVTLNDLLTGLGEENRSGEKKERLASTLMAYARANPHRIRGKLMPVIVYDPGSGREAFGITMRKLRVR